MDLPSVVDPLLKWYRVNARNLPWREDHSPYRVWLSEIMLQQTRVEAVIPYFNRFLAALPSIRALAEAEEEQLLKLWEGLGYYTRVRNLQKAARMIMSNYDGEFPQDYAAIRSLPGIGEYTAGAIASIAFGQPAPAVDGNVLRVLSRLLESREDIRKPKLKAGFTEALRQVYPQKHCGDFTQALMELGATVCLPNGDPKCGECPLASICLAFRNGTFREIPVKTEKKPRRIEQRTILLIHCDGEFALRRRPPRGLLAGMMELPGLDGTYTIPGLRRHLEESGIHAEAIRRGIRSKHIFSHVEWHMESCELECPERPAGFEWFTLSDLRERVSLPTAFQPFASRLAELYRDCFGQ